MGDERRLTLSSSKFVNCMMRDGKKKTSERILRLVSVRVCVRSVCEGGREEGEGGRKREREREGEREGEEE